MTTGIKAVARQAGVSIATVSRVLSNQPYVSEAVRQRVLAAVAELGYQPSRVARRLRRQRSGILGLVVSDIQNSFFTALGRAVEDVAYDHQYAVFLCNSDEDQVKEQLYIDLLMAEQVAGIVISPTCEDDRACGHLLESKIPVVSVDRQLLNADQDRVLTDNHQAAFDLTAHLIGHGHRRIGAMFGPPTITTGRERRDGYLDALAASGIPLDPRLLRTGPPKSDTGYYFANELLDLPDRPTALLGGNNLLTLGALTAIRERKLRIPADIALVSFDEVPWMPIVEPALTVAAQPAYEMGRTAALLLLDRIDNGPGPAQHIVLQSTLRIRSSCGEHSPEES